MPFSFTETASRWMNLPNAEYALVTPEKITRYLLDPANPRNRGKATVFFAVGYTREQWERLIVDLLAHGQIFPVETEEQRGADRVDTVFGPLVGPNGATRLIRTVWQIDAGTDFPRLITAVPARHERRM